MSSTKPKTPAPAVRPSAAKTATQSPPPPPVGTADDDGLRAFELAKASLGGGQPGVTVAEDGLRAELSHLGITFAIVERSNRSVVASMLVQDGDRAVVGQIVGYSPSPVRAGWWQIRLGKEPRRWQEAKVATLAGRTIAALRAVSNVGRWRSLYAATNPYAVVARSHAFRWGDDGLGTDLGEAKACASDVTLLDRSWGHALVLGSSDPLYVHPTEEGALLVRVASLDLHDEQRLRELVAAIPSEIFGGGSLELDVHEPLCAFDASLVGSAITPQNSLTCDLRPGRYAVRSGRYAPSTKVALDLVALTRG